MIDTTCPACDIIYHADEAHLGRGFRCKVCGKILRVERQELEPDLLREVVQATDSKAQQRSRDRWLGIGILLGGAIMVGVWLWVRTPRPESPPASSTIEAIQSPSSPGVPLPESKSKDLKHVVPSNAKHPRPVLTYLPSVPSKSPLPSSLGIPLASKPVVVVPKCAEGHSPERLATGERIEPDEGISGKSTLEITNGLSLDAAVRLVDSSTNKTSRFVYIRAHDAYKIEGIEPSTYTLRYASGLDWITNCADFLRSENMDEFEESFPFRQGTVDEGDHLKKTWTEGSASLNPVPEGTARTRKIEKRRFLEGDQRFSLQP